MHCLGPEHGREGDVLTASLLEVSCWRREQELCPLDGSGFDMAVIIEVTTNIFQEAIRSKS